MCEPELACHFSAGVIKKAVRDWVNRDHTKYWQSNVMGFIQGPPAERTSELLKVNRN
jgi:hypothetical protein